MLGSMGRLTLRQHSAPQLKGDFPMNDHWERLILVVVQGYCNRVVYLFYVVNKWRQKIYLRLLTKTLDQDDSKNKKHYIIEYIHINDSFEFTQQAVFKE